MRFQLAALLTALTAIGGAPVAVSTEDAPDDVARMLVLLEQVVQRGDAAGYTRLLANTADQGRAAAFAAEWLPGVTRVAIRERDRDALPGVLPGDGYRVTLDVFEEAGHLARVSTWGLDVKRGWPPDVDSDWEIADQERLNSVDKLYRLSLDPTKRYTASHLTIEDEDLSLTLIQGSVFVCEIDQGTTALVLLGTGRMRFDPAPEEEKTQVRIFSDAAILDTQFDAVYLRINPGDFDRLVSSGQLEAASIDQDEFRKANQIFREDSPKSYGLDLGALSRDTWSSVPVVGDLVAEIHTRQFGPLTYSRSSASAEDIRLVDRSSRRTITLYSSPLNRERSLSDGEGFDIDVRHYDIDIVATPERRWIEGRTRMTIRVGARPIQSVTLQLAETLVVRSVVSDEYGRLFSMRVKDRGRLIITLPTTLTQGAEVTLTVSYEGRLDPERLDGEATTGALFPAWWRARRAEFPARPEPSFLYTNQSSWYPRPSASHYATATLRITVPTKLTCVASGELDEGSPVSVPANDSSPAQRVYVFNAVKPMRYFSFVMSRMEPIRSDSYDGLKLSVVANPGHARRGRDVADEAADIARFYRSILNDIPYSSFTVALLESDRPGGHSPAYFAVLNERALYAPVFPPRNDPVSFERFPEFFLAHELAHQWWGQAVGWRNYHDRWLSEGFSQYFAALYARQQHGDRVFGQVIRQMRKWAMNTTEAGPISLGDRLGHIQEDPRIFRALVYNKGALVLHMLRQLLGDDTFFSGLRRFYGAARFRSVRTADFRVVMEQEAGRPLKRFFDNWIYGQAIPTLDFSYRLDEGNVVFRFEQVGPVFELPVTVTLQYADRTSADVLVPVTSRLVEFRVPLRGTLRRAEISKSDPPLAKVVKN